MINIIKYSIDSESFFEYDKGGRRGHAKKLFKKSTRLDVNIFIQQFVVDKWNSLTDTDTCVNCIQTKNQSPSRATTAHWAALISVSLALSQTPAEAASPRTRG